MTVRRITVPLFVLLVAASTLLVATRPAQGATTNSRGQSEAPSPAAAQGPEGWAYQPAPASKPEDKKDPTPVPAAAPATATPPRATATTAPPKATATPPKATATPPKATPTQAPKQTAASIVDVPPPTPPQPVISGTTQTEASAPTVQSASGPAVPVATVVPAASVPYVPSLHQVQPTSAPAPSLAVSGQVAPTTPPVAAPVVQAPSPQTPAPSQPKPSVQAPLVAPSPAGAIAAVALTARQAFAAPATNSTRPNANSPASAPPPPPAPPLAAEQRPAPTPGSEAPAGAAMLQQRGLHVLPTNITARQAWLPVEGRMLLINGRPVEVYDLGKPELYPVLDGLRGPAGSPEVPPGVSAWTVDSLVIVAPPGAEGADVAAMLDQALGRERRVTALIVDRRTVAQPGSSAPADALTSQPTPAPDAPQLSVKLDHVSRSEFAFLTAMLLLSVVVAGAGGGIRKEP